MENILSSVKADFISKLKSEQIMVDCVMTVPEDAPVSEILGKSADAVALTAESLEKEAEVTGRVNFKLVYRTGDSEMRALDYYSDFSSKIGLDTSPKTKLFAFGKALSIEIASQTDKEIRLKAIVEIDVIGAVQSEYELADNPALCRKTKQITETSLKEIAEGTFDIYEECESGVNIDKIVLLDTDLVLSGYKTGRDSLLVSGTAVANVTYTSDKGVFCKTFSMPFCEEIASPSAHPDNDVYLYGYIKEGGIVLGGTEENTTLRVELTVSLRCPVFETQEKEVLADAFDLEEDTVLHKKECIRYKKTGEWNFEERLSGSAQLPEGMPLASRIITVCMAKNDPSSVRADKDKINVEGVAVATVVYEDVEGVLRSVEIELPYALSLRAEGAKSAGEVYIRSAVCDVTTALKRAKDIEVMYLLRVYAYGCERERFEIISNIEKKESDKKDRFPLVMYMGGADEDEWEIAKSLKVAPENVIKGEDKRFVVCYRQLEI